MIGLNVSAAGLRLDVEGSVVIFGVSIESSSSVSNLSSTTLGVPVIVVQVVLVFLFCFAWVPRLISLFPTEKM